jgi:hypothetical protein
LADAASVSGSALRGYSDFPNSDSQNGLPTVAGVASLSPTAAAPRGMLATAESDQSQKVFGQNRWLVLANRMKRVFTVIAPLDSDATLPVLNML